MREINAIELRNMRQFALRTLLQARWKQPWQSTNNPWTSVPAFGRAGPTVSMC